MFTATEQNLIKSKIRIKDVAVKHGVTGRYVSMILKGQRNCKSKKAQKIHAELKATLKSTKAMKLSKNDKQQLRFYIIGLVIVVLIKIALLFRVVLSFLKCPI